AQILLAAARGQTDEAIATTVRVGTSTVYRTKRRFVEESLEAALSEDPRPGGTRKLTGREEALLIATACSTPPPGRARWTLALQDYGYRRNGTANVFLAVDAHRPWRAAKVTARRAAVDFAAWMRDLIDGQYAECERLHVVLDNLSTHTAAAFYEAFAPAEARR